MDAGRTTHDQARTAPTGPGAWERIAPARLTPGGPGATDVLGWLSRAALVLLALSLAWLAFAAVRPLSTPVAADELAIRPARPIEIGGVAVAERERLLASVVSTNWFDPERQMWAKEDIAARIKESTQATPAEPPPQTAGADPDPDDASLALEIAGGRLATTNPKDLPDALAKAYANLELLGIRTRADGTLLAMITTVKSPTRPATTPYAIGDTFTDKDFPDEAWRIVLIDATRDRVYLRRAGKTVELPLWKSAPLTVASADAPAATGPSRDEIIAQLRAAGISEEEIAEMFGMIEADQATAQAAAPPVKTLDDALEELEQAKAPEEVKSVSGVLKMMSESETRPRRSDRKRLAFPDVDTYAAAGRGHAVGSVNTDAGVVVLEDGSKWNVAARDAKKINGWGTAAPVSVYRGRGTSRPYVIVNEFTQDFAEADHVVDPADADNADALESADADAGS